MTNCSGSEAERIESLDDARQTLGRAVDRIRYVVGALERTGHQFPVVARDAAEALAEDADLVASVKAWLDESPAPAGEVIGPAMAEMMTEVLRALVAIAVIADRPGEEKPEFRLGVIRDLAKEVGDSLGECLKDGGALDES